MLVLREADETGRLPGRPLPSVLGAAAYERIADAMRIELLKLSAEDRDDFIDLLSGEVEMLQN